MTAPARLDSVRAAPATTLSNLDGWQTWLTHRIDPTWRPGEWNPHAWLFTGDVDNPRTSVWACAVRACPSTLHTRGGLCAACRTDFVASAHDDREVFIATHVPKRGTRAAEAKGPCAVGQRGRQCASPAVSADMCATHHGRWVRYLNRTQPPGRLDLILWRATQQPITQVPDCLVLGCENSSMNGQGLCVLHWRRRALANKHRPDKISPEKFAATQTPYLGATRFSLAVLPPLMRAEVLFGLQRRDDLHRPLTPKAVRSVIDALSTSDVETLLTAAVDRVERALPTGHAQALIRQLRWSIDVAHDEFREVAPTQRDILDLRTLGMAQSGRTRTRIVSGTADLTVIRQLWLRELFRAWIDAERPPSADVRHVLRATDLASRALSRRAGGGHDPACLQFADMSAVVDQFRTALRLDGRPYASKQRHNMLTRFCRLLDFGRHGGLLEQLSGSFARHRSHRIEIDEPNEDEIGKAIPDYVIDQLDTHLDRLGADFAYGALALVDVQAMFRTVYIILRDTGRRPGEVAALRLDCVETVDGETSLVWDNTKGRRRRRRLPITADTAETIRMWRERRIHLQAPPCSAGFLFPAITDDAADPHLSRSNIWLAIRTWVDALPSLHTDTIDGHGNPVPFDRDRVYPRAFRCSYAQRHADAGTPVDVLKDLMDHASVQTTMGYYQVSLKRKQAAVKALSLHVVDRSGNPAPFRSGLAYQRSSVAVPFGGCTEPANVKAGGHACRIRFQCAGCPFYRPDPSYLPAIEQQVNDLRADRETAQAIGTAEFVIRNLTEQIDSYRDVATTMRKNLAELPANERSEIEEASAILRKARAGGRRIQLPITPVEHKDQPR